MWSCGSAQPWSAACERNRGPILDVLRESFADRRLVLEIGSGTGQHAVHFAAALPHLQWQTSDRAPNLAGIRAWLDEAALPNTPPPIELDVARDVAAQIAGGSRGVFGLMVESHIHSGAQKFTPGKDDVAALEYGKSITDACIGWDGTQTILQVLSDAVRARRKR